MSVRFVDVWPAGIWMCARRIEPTPALSPPFCVQYIQPPAVSSAMPTHQRLSSIRSVALEPVVTSASTLEPSMFERMTRIPSRSDQYILPLGGSTRICLGVYVPPAGTSVTTFEPSRSDRFTNPSSAEGLPMPVQKM